MSNSQSPAEKPPKGIYFLHIPKTAGASVHRFLTSALPNEQICPARSWEEVEDGGLASLLKYRVFSGHMADSLEPYIGNRLRTITLLRDPVQRSISYYAHVRRDPSTPHHALAKRLSLRDFCLHPDGRSQLENHQALNLTTRMSLPTPRGDTLPSGEVNLFQAVPATETPMAGSPDEQMLLRARRRLVGCTAVGVTERLTDTLSVFAEVLGLGWSGQTPYEHPSYNRPKIVDEETVAIIQQLTPLDALLHREANALLEAKLIELGKYPDESYISAACPVGDIPTCRVRTKNVVPDVTRDYWLTPEKAYYIKLKIFGLICRTPPSMRLSLSWLYIGYRICIDRRIAWRARLPIALGLCYQPIDLIPLIVPISGLADNAIAVLLGCLGSFALVDKRALADIRLNAVSRFALSG
jgi:hypothetical protein